MDPIFGHLSDWLIPIVHTLLPLAGVVIGAFLTQWATRKQFERERDWQRDQIFRQKLEEIALAADEVSYAYGKFIGQVFAAAMAETAQVPSSAGQRIPFERLTMLVSFYAAELSGHTDKIIAIRDRASERLFKDHNWAGRSRPWSTGEMQEINAIAMQASFELTDACSKLAKATAALARKRLGMRS